MKRMNKAHEGGAQGFKAQILCEMNQMFMQLAVDPRGCWGGLLHEPELPLEFITEMRENCSAIARYRLRADATAVGNGVSESISISG